MSEVLLHETAAGVVTLTLNRPAHAVAGIDC